MSKFFKCPLPYDNVRLTSKFGWRKHPVTGEKKTFHQGIDIARTPNANVDVVASADGEVIRTGKLGTYGYVVMIKHNYNGKRMDTNYAHLKEGSILVKVGQKVKQGQKLATMGNTGSSTAPHLHFEVHNGKWASGQPNAVDPSKYISVDDWKKKESVKPVAKSTTQNTQPIKERKIKMLKDATSTTLINGFIKDLEKALSTGKIKDKKWIEQAKNGTMTLADCILLLNYINNK